MGEYSEIAPPSRLSSYVECFWWFRASESDVDHRVLPDGCTDLIFSSLDGRVRASAVGFMTRAIVSPLAPREEIFGVRFRPAMSHGMLRIPVPMLTDSVVDLETLWGRDAKALEQRLADARSNQERIECIESVLEPGGPPTPVQRAALWVVENRGEASAGELARHAGLSARQFRRLCIEQTGVGPKMLCRIVRFRNAANGVLRQPRNWADFALDHGYYDQAHFINEFREFCGVTPTEYATVFSNTEPGAMP